MRKLFGLLVILGGVAAYFYYVQGWDLARVRETSVGKMIFRVTDSGTTTPIGERGAGTHWETVTRMPDARQYFGAATIGDSIYVVGGVDGYARTLNSLIAYDVTRDAWRKLPNMPQPVHHPAVATDGHKLYVFGGLTGLANRPVDNAYAFDPDRGSWEEIGHLSDFRGSAGAAFADGRLFVIAGAANGGVDGTIEYYDEGRGGWNGQKDAPTARRDLQAATLNGLIYVFGGSKGSTTSALGTLEAFDPKLDSWASLMAMRVPRTGFAGVQQDGRLYAIGGENGAGLVDTIEYFDPAKNEWTRLDLAMPVARKGLAAASWKNRIYVLGGGKRSGFSVTDENEVLILAPATPPAPAATTKPTDKKKTP